MIYVNYFTTCFCLIDKILLAILILLLLLFLVFHKYPPIEVILFEVLSGTKCKHFFQQRFEPKFTILWETSLFR